MFLFRVDGVERGASLGLIFRALENRRYERDEFLKRGIEGRLEGLTASGGQGDGFRAIGLVPVGHVDPVGRRGEVRCEAFDDAAHHAVPGCAAFAQDEHVEPGFVDPRAEVECLECSFLPDEALEGGGLLRRLKSE